VEKDAGLMADQWRGTHIHDQVHLDVFWRNHQTFNHPISHINNGTIKSSPPQRINRVSRP
jgi:hypothetical protein